MSPDHSKRLSKRGHEIPPDAHRQPICPLLPIGKLVSGVHPPEALATPARTPNPFNILATNGMGPATIWRAGPWLQIGPTIRAVE